VDYLPLSWLNALPVIPKPSYINIFNLAMNIKILVVDDEEDVELLMQQRFRRKIAEGTYQFTFANSGQQALAVIQAEPDFDVLLLDINMPEMDGLTLLAAAGPFLSHGRAVIVSAYSDMDNIRRAMNSGAFDFVCKPINFTDLEATIEKTVRHVRELQQLKQQTAQHEEKTRFFDNITHEFRTPLTLILSPIERLLQTIAQDAARTELLAIDRNARYLLRLINQLLETARMDAGFLQLNEQPGELTAFLHQLVQAFQPYARQQQVTLEFQANVTGLWLYDEEKLGQVLYNLISNAIKFTGTREIEEITGLRGQISVTLQAGTPMRLTITDTGPGIPASHLPFIFERFYQVIPQGERKTAGTGIGLSLVKEYIMLMHGTIQVTSRTGTLPGSHGTTFNMELPLQPATTTTSGAVQPASFWDWFPIQDEQPATQPLTPAAQDAALIVLVEDNEELAKYLTDKLSPLYRVLTAHSAEKGWQLIQEELPDVVIADIMLPGMDGYELTHQLRSSGATEHIAVILLTAKTNYDSRLLGLQRGADDYLAKPFHLQELLLRLHNLLTRQQRLRNFYAQQLAHPELPHPMELLQDGWLKELYQVLETHLDNPALSVEWLAGQMAVSRKTLLRKVQALTKLSPNELIRQYRLRKAADLLRAGHSVAETAYAVGFETPAYFGQCFKELFNITPGRFVENTAES
jgi:signal transduction histidine kinase/AraC-like DNA-binding protein